MLASRLSCVARHRWSEERRIKRNSRGLYPLDAAIEAVNRRLKVGLIGEAEENGEEFSFRISRPGNRCCGRDQKKNKSRLKLEEMDNWAIHGGWMRVHSVRRLGSGARSA